MVEGLLGSEGARFVNAGHGQVVGGYGSIPVRHGNDNRAAVLAAQKRAQYQKLLGGITSRRLGGESDLDEKKLTPQELRERVLAAAERRKEDNKRCAVTDSIGAAIEILGIDDSEEEADEQTEGERRIENERANHWSCDSCTLVNSSKDELCQVCERPRTALSVPIRTSGKRMEINLADAMEEETRHSPPNKKKKKKNTTLSSAADHIIDLTST